MASFPGEANGHIELMSPRPTSDGSVVLSDELADTEMEVDGTQGCIKALTQLKDQYPGLKIILSIGGGGQGSTYFASIAGNHTARMIFASTAKGLVDMYGFDGIDSMISACLPILTLPLLMTLASVDWEHPASPAEGIDYISLLDTIRHFLPSSRYIVTSALPAAAWALSHIDLSLASTYLTFINLMAYDFCGPWSPTSGHHSRLFSPLTDPSALSAHAAVLYCLEHSVHPSKILLGIPAYGHSFPGATGPDQAYPPSALPNDNRIFEYRSIPLTGTEQVDEQLGTASIVDPVDGFITYDNVATVKMKAAYVQRMRLGGMFYWTGTGDVRGSRSLVEAGYNALHDL
ncbi:hypothetical protein MMC11_000224 [Xylographa trunciseda]|nr:hypothetical protein [Xylographa trunciseda]